MPIPDWQKQKREYLTKKTVAWRTFTAYSFMLTLLLVTTLSFGYISFLFVWGEIPLVFGANYISGGLALLMTLYVGWCCKQGGHDVKNAYKEVCDTYHLSDTLPAEEVLVRSSQEPEKEQSNILLRASENADTPAEELLRASNGEQRQA